MHSQSAGCGDLFETRLLTRHLARQNGQSSCWPTRRMMTGNGKALWIRKEVRGLLMLIASGIVTSINAATANKASPTLVPAAD